MIAVATITPNPAVDVSTSVERIVPASKLRCAAARRDPGGGGINVARVIKRLGGNPVAIYPHGGATGHVLSQLVAREQIASRVCKIAEETREDFSIEEKRTGQQYRFVLPGPALNESEWRACLACLDTLESSPGFVVASGSLPPGVPADFYARVGQISKSRNAKFALDSSGTALAAALAPGGGVYLCKPNLRELSELVGTRLDDEASWIAASRGLVERGQAEIVALTLGHRGALLATADLTLRAQALPIVPVSSVGAGDSFLGGLIFGLATGFELEQAFRYAVAAGSSALLNHGTELCHAQDTVRLAAHVLVEPL
ncbi:MAG TPA: 1-phosphofructokinase family hexose kinase [Xanthobacteraceae bacterium]|jgi:6-phosphofructokinase 2|nr:1-phosphofructokinase family hexose kinase [Xanthobacteraceae bacterium]